MSVLGNARRIISTNATRGENRYMLEEVYFSDIVQEDEAINNSQQASTTPNPYRAYKDASGYFHYQFPSLWYTSTSNNKAIGLRRIETKARAKNITFKFHFELEYPSEAVKEFDESFNLHFLPTDDIDTIMSTMCYKFNEFINSTMARFAADKRQYNFAIHYKYDDVTNEAMFYAIRNVYDTDLNALDWTNHSVAFVINSVNDDFKTVFNMDMNYDIDEYGYDVNANMLGVPDGAYTTQVYRLTNV